MSPAQIGPYVVLGELGHGASGSVLRARGAEGEVALKLLRNATKDALARFERERRVHASLGVEQGFVPLLGVGEAAPGPYIVMPLVAGGTLRARLARGPLDPDSALALGRRLARALARAHTLGIVHRDVKPENVLFDAAGRPLVADLGLAKHFRPSLAGTRSVSLTRSGASLGTPGYMPYEQLASAKEVGPAADVFALGAIIYECLAGRAPFEAATLVELAALLEEGAFPPLRRLRPETPPWLASVVERALAKDPGRRWPDASALAVALERGPARPRRPLLVAAAAVVLVAGAAAVVGIPVAERRAARDHLARAEALLAEGRQAESRAEAERALALDESLERAWAVRGAARRATGDAGGALTDLDRALALERNDAGALTERGITLDALGQEKEALAALTRAIELGPRPILALHQRALVLLRRKDFKAASADAQRALGLDPRDLDALRILGAIRESTDDLDGMSPVAERLIELAPGDASGWAYRGWARDGRSDYDGAIDDCTRALELDPRCAGAWRDRGLARVQKGEADGAIADESRSLELDPSDAWVWAWRGVARFQKGDARGALEDAEQSIERKPGESMLYLNRAMALEQLGETKRAIADYERYVTTAPHDAAWQPAQKHLEALRASARGR